MTDATCDLTGFFTTSAPALQLRAMPSAAAPVVAPPPDLRLPGDGLSGPTLNVGALCACRREEPPCPANARRGTHGALRDPARDGRPDRSFRDASAAPGGGAESILLRREGHPLVDFLAARAAGSGHILLGTAAASLTFGPNTEFGIEAGPCLGRVQRVSALLRRHANTNDLGLKSLLQGDGQEIRGAGYRPQLRLLSGTPDRGL